MLLKRTITQTNFQITSRLDLQNFLIEFYQVYQKVISQHVSQFFICLKRPGIFAQRIYQLKNFDMNLKGCYQSCLFL